ncbi:MAG: hypothetical protein HC899_36095 [Leptolyngbyaceae cyanobacterium SM1_4_3]|nr:hypothetical protein [Leptolyngbyaceae cyanobacterium SM1_4_3]
MTLDWLLIAIVTALAGTLNLLVAFQELEKTREELLFLEPLKSPGFWLWVMVQMSFPALAFLLWVTDFFTAIPVVDVMLFVKAVGAGFGFAAFLNARTEVGFISLNLKSIYTRLLELGYKSIIAQEVLRTNRFLRELEEELYQDNIDLIQGLKNLRGYFSIYASALPTQIEEREEYQKYVEVIDQVLEKPKSEQVEVVKSLFKQVKQRHLLDALQQFKRHSEFDRFDQFLEDNLPKRLRGAIANPKKLPPKR